MSFKDLDLNSFANKLFSKAPAPGGGGASAVVGALGVALAGMVGNLTAGKSKFAQFEENAQEVLRDALALQNELLNLADKDAEAFLPLSKAYSLPKDAPDREKTMEQCLKTAAAVPFEILHCVCRAVELHGKLEGKCSTLAVSDIATGVMFCRGALYGAAVNVKVNTKLMKDRAYAESMDRETQELLAKYSSMADGIYERICSE